jgi:putative sterol carrier protein
VGKFPSAGWAELFRTAVNESAEYATAAQAWEGEVLLRILPGQTAAPVPGIHLDLAHGACRSATFLSDSGSAEAEIVLEGEREEWQRILRREADPVREVLSGRLKIRGNFAKAMRFTKATTLLVAIASSVPTEF